MCPFSNSAAKRVSGDTWKVEVPSGDSVSGPSNISSVALSPLTSLDSVESQLVCVEIRTCRGAIYIKSRRGEKDQERERIVNGVVRARKDTRSVSLSR